MLDVNNHTELDEFRDEVADKGLGLPRRTTESINELRDYVKCLRY